MLYVDNIIQVNEISKDLSRKLDNLKNSLERHGFLKLVAQRHYYLICNFCPIKQERFSAMLVRGA